MQYPSPPPDAPENPASLQFPQLYTPMPLPPTRRRVQWGRAALIVVSVVVCVAIMTGIAVNVLRIIVVPEVHATLAAGAVATIKTASGEMVTVTIDQINPNAVGTSPSLPPGYLPYTIMTSVPVACTSGNSFEWTATGSDGKTYRGPAIGVSSQCRTPMSMLGQPTTQVLSMSVDFQIPNGVVVRSVICSLPSSQFGGHVQTTEGRLYFDAP